MGEQYEMSKARLQVHFDVHQPIELVEFTLAMQSLAREYQTFLIQRTGAKPGKGSEEEARLFITRIENNCILAELAESAALLGHFVATVDQLNVFMDFSRNLRAAFDFFVGAAQKDQLKAEDVPYNKQKMSNLKQITSLAAKNSDGKLGITVLNYESDDSKGAECLRIEFGAAESQAAHRGIVASQRALEARERADYERVLMYFHQTNRDDPKPDGKTGDLAVIGHVTDRPLRCYILSEIDQQKIRYVLDDTNHNPLQIGFLVDVNVEKNPSGKPMVYRVIRLHDVIYDDTDE